MRFEPLIPTHQAADRLAVEQPISRAMLTEALADDSLLLGWTRRRLDSLWIRERRALPRADEVGVSSHWLRHENTPVIVDNVVRDIDAIAKQVRYSGWSENQEGDRKVRPKIRIVLRRFRLPLTGPLCDRAYAYIRENY